MYAKWWPTSGETVHLKTCQCQRTQHFKKPENIIRTLERPLLFIVLLREFLTTVIVIGLSGIRSVNKQIKLNTKFCCQLTIKIKRTLKKVTVSSS